MPRDDERLYAALDRETRELNIGPSPLTDMMRVGSARRRWRRVAVASGTAALVAIPTAVVALGWRPTGDSGISPGHVQRPATPSTVRNHVAPQDQIVVLGEGVFQGRRWRLVRDRFLVTEAADSGTARNLLTVEHLPFSEYDKAGTVACEALGFQFGNAAPGTPADYDVGYSCSGGTYVPPAHFAMRSFDNGMDKRTGRPTLLQSIGDGPAPGSDGATAVSAALTIDGVAGEHQALLSVSGESVAYYAFVVPATTDHEPKVTVTFYNAAGDLVSTIDANPPMAK